MKVLKYFLLFLLIPILSLTVHKYYVSLTQIDYNQKNKLLEITVRVFIDDLNKALNQQYDKEFNLGEKNELKNTDYFIKKYFENNFILKVNNQHKDYKLVGKEYEDNICYIYFEISNVANVSSLEITNSILQEIFEEQQNIIKTNINAIHHSLILTAGNDKGLLKF